MMYALIDCNNFFVSCERAFNRRLEGRPVAVLSNNDGCVVARSLEVKALNIAMGTPYFQLREQERLCGIVFLSSNYELYADMSRRVMAILRELTPTIEQYSIDEAFAELNFRVADYHAFGLEVRRRIRQWTGLPVGIGFGRTRTLAKAASHIAKKRTCDQVFVMPDDNGEILSTVPVGDIWGVGRRTAQRLHYLGVETAGQLASADLQMLQQRFNVCLVRTALELRGFGAVVPEEICQAPMNSICCSRTFGTPITRCEELRQAFFTYGANAAERLRTTRRQAASLYLFVQYADATLPVNDSSQFAGVTVTLPCPTANTSEFYRSMSPAVPLLFREGMRHRKCGVVCLELEQTAPQQLELFSPPRQTGVSDQLFTAIDELNRRYGKQTVYAAGEGIAKTWQMRRGRLSQRYTTCWEELPVAQT